MGTARHHRPVSEALRHAERLRDEMRGQHAPAPTHLDMIALADEIHRLRAKLAKAQVRR